MSSAVEAVANHLAAQADLGLALGTDLFMGPPRAASDAMPRSAVFVEPDSGDSPLPYLGSDSGSVWLPAVSITVRSAPDDFSGGFERARACLRALHKASIPGFFSCLADDSEPDYLDRDDAGCHEFGFSVALQQTG